MTSVPHLPSPDQAFLEIFIHLSNASSSLPTSKISTAVELRHRFLSLSPSDPGYLSSKPSLPLSELLESLFTLTPLVDASKSLWKLEIADQTSSLEIYRCWTIKTEERPNDSFVLVLVYEDEEWKYFDSCLEVSGFCESYELAHEDFEGRLREAKEGMDDYWGDGQPVTQYHEEQEELSSDLGETEKVEGEGVLALKATLKGLFRMWTANCGEDELAMKKLTFIEAVGDVVNVD